MAILSYVYVFAVCFIANSMQSSYEPCASGPNPTSVKVLGCDSLPCNLRRGTTAQVAVDFNVIENTKTLTPEVKVQLGSITTPYPLPEQNACNSLTSGQCPLEKGERATYLLKMPVEKAYPKVSLTIQLSLVDEHKKSQACFRIPAHVVD
ncbi:NPC intracellular cholesterol transporter 2 homolog a [Xylocopa sonorina]|uniref:NPC intracellular cholesterol transporter 2 homolog a n=1 Tax=Xylocopa sonorina TaxID=1818115 RepID=UPI00403B11DC